jgi:3-oxoacyl-[acyl-carrier protein] reductase
MHVAAWPGGDMGTLDGRVAIVTGGARGIGREYGLGLSREGCAVMIADLRGAEAAAEMIRGEGREAASIDTDVGSRESTERMANGTADRFGKIDILVNNAAYYTHLQQATFDNIEIAEWDKAFATNVRGHWLCSRAVYPYMRAQRYGKIINISSMTVWDGTPNFLHYVATKAAVIGFTRALAREVGDENICVNTVTPDYIPHDSDYASRQPGVDEMLVSQRCFKRTQVPADMVGTVVFLSGSGSDFITGQNIAVNGGRRFL